MEWNQQERESKMICVRFSRKTLILCVVSLVFFYQGFFLPRGSFFQNASRAGKKRNSRPKRRNFRSERQEPCRWVKWAFMTLIVITLMLLWGIDKNFREFHFQIRFLEAQCPKTPRVVGSPDFKVVKIAISLVNHFKCMWNQFPSRAFSNNSNWKTFHLEVRVSHFRFLWIHHPQEFLSKLKSVNLTAVKYSFLLFR